MNPKRAARLAAPRLPGWQVPAPQAPAWIASSCIIGAFALYSGFDPRKSERNLRERGFGFEIASEFDLRSALFAQDARTDYGEVRIRAIGLIGDTLYALVFTMRGNALRVISLRRASRKERSQYEKAKS
jgi:hypothetical protein